LTRTGFYEFQPVASGEFSAQVYADVDSLSKDGLVSIHFSEREGSRIYRVTPAGAERARKLEKHVRPDLIELLRKTVAWVSTRSVDQLLRGSVEKVGSREPVSKARDSIRPRGSP
jgi:DNA-binding PadR family transcriptional regulator